MRYDIGPLANPLSMALQWAAQGTRHLHVVDLDASYGRMSVVPALLMAMMTRSIQISVAGGIRDIPTARERLTYGASHVVTGSLLTLPSVLRKVAQAAGPGRLWGSLYVQDGVMVSASADIVANNARGAGIKNLILTARHPENMAQPGNLRIIEHLRHEGFNVWTSGQISDVRDIIPMYQAGAQGV